MSNILPIVYSLVAQEKNYISFVLSFLSSSELFAYIVYICAINMLNQMSLKQICYRQIFFCFVLGLDPADPYFQGTDPVVRLDPTDAAFVDVIHTDGSR